MPCLMEEEPPSSDHKMFGWNQLQQLENGADNYESCMLNFGILPAASTASHRVVKHVCKAMMYL